MMIEQDIDSRVLTMLRQTLQNEHIRVDDPLDLSSMQILRVLSQAEREFSVEIEDGDVFRGLFTSAARLIAYIRQQIDAA